MVTLFNDMRPSGIPVLGAVPWGSHFCQFYQTKEHLRDVLVPYFQHGLENDEFCVWVTSEALTAEEARHSLAKVVPDLAERERQGQFEVFPYTDWYLAGGTFDMQRVLAGWHEKYCSGLERGYAGLRVSGNTAWLESSNWDSFSQYEESIDSAIEGSRILVLCTYSLDHCGPYELLDVVRNHQFALVLGQRGWERIEHAELRRVREMHQASENRYHQLFSAMNEGFALHEIICDDAGLPVDYRFLDLNPAFERLTGLKREDILGRTLREVMPDAEPSWVERYGAVALTGEPAHFRDYAGPLDRWFDVFAYSPAPRQFAAMFLDVTEVEKSQEQLRRTAEELARSNQDLEQFAYVASHDLQEPLRMISGFLEILENRYGAQLDDKARKYIGHSVDGAARMSNLIRDLLAYSRVDRKGKAVKPVDGNQALAAALANLHSAIREADAKITHDPLPTLNADGAQLTQLFQNLIGNAVKFRRTGQPCLIHLGVERREDHWVFSVQDNGIGIPPDQCQRVFEIFHRLHTRNEYPGTGIGLAICKRIVERHGGRIWLESQPDEGTTFFFTFPADVPLMVEKCNGV